jgi:hypothetical protein
MRMCKHMLTHVHIETHIHISQVWEPLWERKLLLCQAGLQARAGAACARASGLCGQGPLARALAQEWLLCSGVIHTWVSTRRYVFLHSESCPLLPAEGWEVCGQRILYGG